jgi:hypothetical protein
MIPSKRKKAEQEKRGAFDFDANSAKERELALLAGHITNAQLSANIWFKTSPPNLRAEDCTNVEEWVDKLYKANLQRIKRSTDPRRNRGYTRGSHLLFRG